MASKLFLVALSACLVAALAAEPAAPKGVKFIAKHIVANVTTDCPVKNVLFAKTEFDVEELPALMEVLQKGKVSEKCQEEAVSLMGCYSDGSLAIKTGCCAKECAEAIDKSITSGCFVEYAKAVCGDKDAKKKFYIGLTNAGTRCAGYEGTCESVLAGAPLKKANGTATNATKEADAAPAVAAAPKDATKSSALTAVASALLPLAAGAAVLLAL